MNPDTLIRIFMIIAPLSLASFGGASSIYAPMQHEVVDIEKWVTAREFLDLFAISRAMPGPGSLFCTLIGWQVAGLAGAIVASLAIYLPSSVLVYGVGHVWSRHRGKRWHSALEKGLNPLGAGLLFAGVVTLAKLASDGPLPVAIILVVCALNVWKPKTHPVVYLMGGGALCYAAYAFA
jgi:chromate transporter